jgi:hypothetical protein
MYFLRLKSIRTLLRICTHCIYIYAHCASQVSLSPYLAAHLSSLVYFRFRLHAALYSFPPSYISPHRSPRLLLATYTPILLREVQCTNSVPLTSDCNSSANPSLPATSRKLHERVRHACCSPKLSAQHRRLTEAAVNFLSEPSGY